MHINTHYIMWFFLTNTFLLISLTLAQNEDVVEQFLKENVTAGRMLMLRFISCMKIMSEASTILLIWLAALLCIFVV